MKSRKSCPFYALCFSFWNWLTKLKCRYFIFSTLVSHISINTFVWVGGKLLADPRPISWEHSYFKSLQRHRSCQSCHWCTLQVWLCRPPLCLKNTHIKPKNPCQCSHTGKILSFSIFLPQMLAYGCSVYLEYCLWLTIHDRNCLKSASLSRGAETASMSLPNPFLFFTHLAVLGFLLS